MSRSPGTVRDVEEGAIAGLEAVALGILVLVVGVLLVVNAWGVADAHLAVSGAAREAARAYVEAPGPDVAASAARTAAIAALAAQGRDPARMQLALTGSFERCAQVSSTVRYEVPAVVLPDGLGFDGAITVSATHAERVDPLRTGVPGEASCVAQR
ncbi:MAG: hypothetical protein ACR2MA_04060 [Egibacteraceae bacterium]